jgi:hypothetical protein
MPSGTDPTRYRCLLSHALGRKTRARPRYSAGWRSPDISSTLRPCAVRPAGRRRFALTRRAANGVAYRRKRRGRCVRVHRQAWQSARTADRNLALSDPSCTLPWPPGVP